MNRIAVLERIHEDGIDALRDFAEVDCLLGLDRASLLERIGGYDGIVVKSVTQVDATLMDRARRLKVIGRAGTGIDNIDVSEARRRGIAVKTVPGGNALSAAEFAVFSVLALARRLPEVLAASRAQDYRRHLLEGREIRALTIGILGIGAVGLLTAERLAPFGCRLIGHSRSGRNADAFRALGGTLAGTVEEVVTASDVLSLHLKLVAETRHLVNDRLLGLARPGLMLVNTARGAIVDDAALLRALESGQVAAMVTDVLDPEPPFDAVPPATNYTHPLLNHPRVLATPHIGASTTDAQRMIAITLANDMLHSLTSVQAPALTVSS